MNTLFNRICKIEKYFAMFGIVVLTLCIFLGAVSRTLGKPLSWTTDIGMLMLTWSTFLGGDIAFREGRLANLDIVVAKFPKSIQKTLVVIIYAIIIIFLCSLVYLGTRLTYTTRFRTFNGVPNFSFAWVTVSLPCSAVFMIVTAVKRVIVLLKSNDCSAIAKM
ncbi:TRAP transporter small permease [Sphaerochaeta globosa]|uniref:Tripartite ATP-independent periplasmic transporter DctQ component n=1 Tax=Sphaerochaeta globosa (strain ATCC BAA-1886 / DSM 22777 / Buddy) TaxID=158189 RepID=F0RTC4_SPHGB|nr:TRAP transporter small permease subunit [Sphaerochaeta globosa]ADY14368.1 Tripartite ATP-independent periplasmic transporter DctQ component [Sphaerochaeta globosa str. Buddy]